MSFLKHSDRYIRNGRLKYAALCHLMDWIEQLVRANVHLDKLAALLQSVWSHNAACCSPITLQLAPGIMVIL